MDSETWLSMAELMILYPIGSGSPLKDDGIAAHVTGYAFDYSGDAALVVQHTGQSVVDYVCVRRHPTASWRYLLTTVR